MAQNGTAIAAGTSRASGRDVKTRRINFTFGTPAPMRKHFFADDIVQSHLLALLSASFPEGEEGFIRSVRRYSDKITDPELKKQVAGFIGQEMTHGREHRNLNDKLQEMGYPVNKVESRMKMLAKLENWLPPIFFLATTAAAEHGTAIMAERVLTSDEIQNIASDPEVRSLLNWHSLEELEHKAVAFDVFRAAGGSERMRIGTSLFVNFMTAGLILEGLAGSLLRDPAARNPARLIPSLLRLPRSPFIQGLGVAALRYLRPGFHPDDHDTSAVLDHWRAKLFGKDGSLVDHLK